MRASVIVVLRPRQQEQTATPFLSVIIPVFGNPVFMEACLSSIRQSEFSDFEIVVADDASPDAEAIREVAFRHNARVVRLDRNRGPATARNRAAREATGEVLVFLDSDVTVHVDTLGRIAEAFRSDPQLSALMGSYDLDPDVQGTVATFRNLLHAHVHHRSSRQASTFWAGCGGVRRAWFGELGGFDESYPQPSIEDVEFGMRLHRAGGKLELDPNIQVRHAKRWTLFSMFHADTFLRAMPWTGLMLRHGLPDGLNFRWQDRVSLLLATLLPALALLALRFGRGWWLIAGAALAAVGLLQAPLFRFLARTRSGLFSAACFPLYLVHLWSAAIGFALGLCRWAARSDRWLPASAGALALLIFAGIQAAGGAYTAEFNAYPDEPAHFITGLMIRDYMAQWPGAHPLVWAQQYYVHYPKVAFGHWPPLFHLTEAAWWLFTPPSRVSGMLLVGLLGWIAAVCFYRIARTVVHPSIALLAACVLVATPVFQASAAQQMTELLTLALGLLTMDALIRFLRDGTQRAFAEAGLWCGLALLSHGTAICLVPVAFLAVLPGGRWRQVRMRCWVWFAGWVAAGLLWYALPHSAKAHWAGLGAALPWQEGLLIGLAGVGVAILAALGALTLLRSYEPVAVVSTALLISITLGCYAMRAMREPRHFILAVPALLLLSLVFARFVWMALPRPGGVLAAGACAALALIFFPWMRYQQTPVGYVALASQVKRPARMLVSTADGWEEGSWIVVASLREARPGSVIIRATKVLANMGWNGDQYELLTDTPAKVATALDGLGVVTVVLDRHTSREEPFAHHQLLENLMASSSAWKQCGKSGSLFAYCRTQALPVPREPLRMELRLSSGAVVQEDQ